MKVKICGMTHFDDAEHASKAGADYIGMIFFERSKRNVLLNMAKSIVDAAREAGAEPVGVFVDQTAEQIISICKETRIETVQLHGSVAKKSMKSLSERYSIINSISIEKEGIKEPTYLLPVSTISLYDNQAGGTGVAFNWKTFSPPQNTRWILAGGLTPYNVAEAIALLNPYGVDVATGVELPHMTRKDPFLVKLFIQTAKQLREKTL